jgi:hypothetical protein
MAIDDILFHMAVKMAESRIGNPKYIVTEIPKIGEEIKIYAFIGNATEAAYEVEDMMTPLEINRKDGLKFSDSYFLLKDENTQLVVGYSKKENSVESRLQ